MIEQEPPNSGCNESRSGVGLCVLTGSLMALHSDVRSLNFRATNSFVLWSKIPCFFPTIFFPSLSRSRSHTHKCWSGQVVLVLDLAGLEGRRGKLVQGMFLLHVLPLMHPVKLVWFKTVPMNIFTLSKLPIISDPTHYLFPGHVGLHTGCKSSHIQQTSPIKCSSSYYIPLHGLNKSYINPCLCTYFALMKCAVLGFEPATTYASCIVHGGGTGLRKVRICVTLVCCSSRNRSHIT